ncbi:MAG: LysM peptidoglycan-binding domain-containing protein [Nitriliruptorales bacterium]|nr:LysM peptidoglycan-binding domain-containing protein [Nitriliruptorales bacterium]
MTAAVIDQRRPVRLQGTQHPVPGSHARCRPVFLVRRLIVALVVAAMVVALASLWALRSEASSGDKAVAAMVVVGPGETVWDIAHEYVPDGVHPQAYVAAVVRHNEVDPAAIVPGTVLELPHP